ncbi:MAG: FHA domain-containing protein [Planctomycetaceae bacterium]|nr:FHA domain-containing protein [Planctomycetaceae bacterium]
MMSQLCVRVCDEAHGVEKVYQLRQPYAILGPGAGSDIALPTTGNVKPRRFYLQAVDAGVIAVELASRKATATPAAAKLIGPDNPLRIGPYAILAERSIERVSSAKGRRNGSHRLVNRLLDDTWLFFVNGHSRATRKSVRHLRETLTLIGRSRRCHLKLSHPRVSRFQCSIVRSGSEFWTVALSRRNELRVNGHPVKNSRLTVGDILSVGPFRMQLQQGARPGSSPSLLVNGDVDHEISARRAEDVPRGLTVRDKPPSGELTHDVSLEWETVRCASDTDVISLVEQFTAVQQLLMAQSQQQAAMLLHLIRNVQSSQESQQALLFEQITAIQGISDELQAWRAELEQQATPPRLNDHRPPCVDTTQAIEGGPSQPVERIPKTAEEIQAHASLSERINFLERERKSIVQKIIRLLPGTSGADS